ncbi:MAG: pyridoxal phosphate-dependent aminotransferase [Syntrophales bacterium]|jgi:aspartate aminotransferase|nr:pyridoxal phosphate-dependent aminotransferase [Syntrophales bacterium]MCK9528203.1 pyridoxal phosphate-dependent aminotransferase [Syntrophales bacterium]MDX9921351.1 pyridoxal phosphate-dependent aminotransferase [Syntrophales bacterium]
MKLAKRASRIKPSPTLAISAKANAMRAEGRDVISFGAGEPDFDTPDHIKQAALAAMKAGFTKYTPVGGINELKDAITAKLLRDNGLSYTRSNICVSCGAKHAIYNLAQVLFEQGDEVIIPAPYWVSYPDIVALAGATPCILPTSEKHQFKMTPEDLERAVSPKTRGLILNSPSNPTGSAYTAEELRAIVAIVKKHPSIVVISDDIYEKIIYDGLSFTNIASLDEGLKEQTIVVNGVSKSHAMTGWRIGYAAGPEAVIAAATNVQSQNTSNPASISQKAAVAALRGDQGPTERMVGEFAARRDYITAALNDMPGVSCLKPQGAFYVFPNVAKLYGTSCEGRDIDGSAALTAFLLEVAEIAVVPGVEFGSDDHVRLSYATSMENIERGMARMREALARLLH